MIHLYTILIAGLVFSLSGMAQERNETKRERDKQMQAPAKPKNQESDQIPQRTDDRRSKYPVQTGRNTERVDTGSPRTQMPGVEEQTMYQRSGRQPSQEYKSLFGTVQEGLSGGNIAGFARHFGSQVSVNLRGGERGNYSGSQAYYILENYLKSRKVVYVDFTRFGESDVNPYATGSAAFNVKGNRELLQVYVSLSFVEERWVITQINIY